jgi:hypothetical protein
MVENQKEASQATKEPAARRLMRHPFPGHGITWDADGMVASVGF